MIKKYLFLAVSLFICMGAGSFAYSLQQMNSVLNPADSLFEYMENKNYENIWKLLSRKSKMAIVSDVFKDIKKTSKHLLVNKKNIYRNFQEGKDIAKTYWNAYLKYFNPKLVLYESQWNIKYIDKEKAEISIKYKKAPKPIYLKMFKENGQWKVGLAETFF